MSDAIGQLTEELGKHERTGVAGASRARPCGRGPRRAPGTSGHPDVFALASTVVTHASRVEAFTWILAGGAKGAVVFVGAATGDDHPSSDAHKELPEQHSDGVQVR